MSAATIKGILRGRTTTTVPREGTQIRAIYDLFYSNKGRVVDFCATTDVSYQSLTRLVDIYGLDIRRIRKNKWCLVGEWFGKVYVDYTQTENR